MGRDRQFRYILVRRTRKRLGLLVFVASFLLNMAYGAEIDSVTAKTVARNFLSSRASQSSLRLSPVISNEVVLVHQENSNQLKPLYYVFNTKDDHGFIIISGDDRVTPVLGYSFTGAYSTEDQPPAFKDWMNNVGEQIKFQIENKADSDDSIQEEWSNLISMPSTESIEQVNDVLPLLTTIWNQDCYYNELCPTDNDGPCDRAYAGCVATAMGQIMKYWDHPVSSTKIPGYYANSDYACLPDIATTYYNWSSMPDELTFGSTNTEIHAVAELLYNAGVACYMDYSAHGSGATAYDARNALVSYFHYSSSMEYRMKYADEEEAWEAMLRDELDNGRPVLYGGSGTIGHAFVCDGYQGTDYFHFNWGWSGYQNGYFYLSDLSPGGDNFNNFQSAIIGISPEASQPDPLDNILDIMGAGSGNTQTFIAEGTGAWDVNNCYYYTPGEEQVYSFVPAASGYYSIEVVTANRDVAYSWRQTDCGEAGWECIEEVSSAGTYGNLNLSAGSTYHILLDDMDELSSTHQFYISLTSLATPAIEYFSHLTDDDMLGSSSGDNDGIAEPGESIEIYVTLRNSGDADAQNVSAVLSTFDSDISITTASSSFGDISAGSSVQSAGACVFNISPDCPEKEVTFALDISSDEGSWSDQFSIHVYVDIPLAPVLEYASHQVDDSAGSGDDDGIAEQGESINLPLSLRNTGDGDAHHVTAVLSTSDSDIHITTASSSFGGILAGSSAISTVDYALDITPDCPEKEVTFILNISSDEGSWSDEFTLNVRIDLPPMPEIIYISHQIDDHTSSGDDDGLAEGGELINMPITLKNTGDADAANVSAVLSAVDPLISIITASNNFYNIPAGGSAQSSGNYSFEVSSECPEKDVAFTLDITSDEGSWTVYFIVHINNDHTSINEIRHNTELLLYPNPVNDIVYLKPEIGTDTPTEIRIVDNMGRMVYLQSYPSLIKDETIEIDLSEFDSGMYFFHFRHSGKSTSRKIIVE